MMQISQAKPARRPLTLEAALRGESPPDGGFTRAEWDALHAASIRTTRECRARAAATAERLGVEPAPPAGWGVAYRFRCLRSEGSDA